MRNTKYNKIADKHKAPEDRMKNFFFAFFCGGIIGFVGELEIEILCKFNISRIDAGVTKFKCGLIIPITGFAHSMTSSALDYKKEGLIYGVGSNMFKLAGSVIIYGIVSAWFFGIIRYLIEVIL